jgi:hypothetical protein
MVLDDAGNPCVTGSYRSARSWDIRTVKYAAADGERLWKQNYDDPYHGEDTARRIARDAAGNLYVTCEASSGRQTPGGQEEDIILLKYDTNGIPQWKDPLSFDFNHRRDWPSVLAVDAAGNITIAGKAGIGTGPTWDYLTLRFDSKGIRQWVKPYSGRGGFTEYAQSMVVDSRGNSIVNMRVYDGKPVPNQRTLANDLTIKYAPDGQIRWQVRRDTAERNDSSVALAVDHQDHVIVAGKANNDNSTPVIRIIKYAP